MLFSSPEVRVVFVCSANICRSPLAEGLMRKKLREHGLHKMVGVDSAGTRASQPGHRPDVRVQQLAKVNKVSLRRIKARPLTQRDFIRHDYVLAMDHSNMKDMEVMCPPALRHKLALLMSYAPQYGLDEVPDPYYGNLQGFEEIYGFIDAAVTGLTETIAAQQT